MLDKLLYPAGEASLPLPLFTMNSDYDLFAATRQGNMWACGVQYFSGVCVNRELMIWGKGGLLAAGFVYPEWVDQMKRNKGFMFRFRLKRVLRSCKQVDERVIWALDSYATGGYYHWITEIIPRLWLVRHLLPTSIIAIPDYFLHKWPFCKQFLNLLGVRRLLLLDKRSYYQVESLVVPTRPGSPFFRQPIPLVSSVQWIQSKVSTKDSFPRYERIYISRRMAAYRHLENEVQLLPVLNRFGFSVICLEEYSIEQQIGICSHAKVMMGVHGAGLSNLAFMGPGSLLIEIRPDISFSIYNCFYTLAINFKCKYTYIKCGFGKRMAAEHRLEDCSVVADPHAVAERLEQIFALV